MNAPYFIEVLNRNGDVRHRHRLEALPIRLGRGYDNDFILDDRHTSAHHAIIDLAENGEMEIRDLGSRNGVVCKGRRRDQMSIDGNTVFRLGHTNLRVRPADFPVADEMKDTTLHGWEGWPPALTGLGLFLMLTVTSVWYSNTEQFEAVRYITAFIGLLALGLLWCGGWSLANRLSSGQTRFGRHFFIVSSGLVVVEVVSLVCAVAAYAFSAEVLTRYASHIALAIVAGMVYFHLRTINPMRMRRFVLVSVFLSIAGSGLMLIFNYQNSGHLADELYMSDLFPPALRLSSDKSVDQFLSEAKGLKGRIDVERSKEVSSDGEIEDGLD